MDEVIVDESGYVFRMPRITRDDIERYGLSHWDMLDWQWGTCIPMAALLDLEEPWEPGRIDRALWRVENKLRYYMWLAFFKSQNRGWRAKLAKMAYMILARLRQAWFRIASKYTCGW